MSPPAGRQATRKSCDDRRSDLSDSPDAVPRPVEEVPRPAGGPLATLRVIRADPLAGLTRLGREYGPAVRLSSRPDSAFLVADPTAIGDGLVRSSRPHRQRDRHHLA